MYIYHAVHWRHYLKHILCSDDVSTVLSCHLCPWVLWHLAEVSYSTWANSSERNQMTQSFSVPCPLAFLMPAAGIITLCKSGSTFPMLLFEHFNKNMPFWLLTELHIICSLPLYPSFKVRSGALGGTVMVVHAVICSPCGRKMCRDFHDRRVHISPFPYGEG